MLHEFDDASDAAAAQADAVARIVRDALARGGRATLALSGGRSPAPFFDALSRHELDWPRVALRLVDERLVPRTHEHSNERLVRERLLQHRAAAADFEGLVADGADPAAEDAAALAARLERLDRDSPPLCAAVLGMGDDGHIASLFSGAPEFAAAVDPTNPARWCVIHPPPPVQPPHARISMTLAALLAAGRLVLAISGPAKRAVFERALRQPSAGLPVGLLLDALEDRGRSIDVYWHP